MPAPYSSGEKNPYNPQILPPSPEAGLKQVNIEPRPAAPEQSGPGHSPPPTPVLPAPVQSASQTQPVTPVLNPLGVISDSPAVAADDEVIEKEWVDKAKRIVIETKDNPYQQEKEVSKLQADYLKKRYGKDVKISSD